MKERTKFAWMVAVFLAAWYLPIGSTRVQGSLTESFAMLHEYAREHVLLCLVPAFFIAGAISVFVRQASVMKYLGARASKWLAYPVASVSGTILAVCSCTVLPLFSGIHKRGAGLGPATTFLYSGPAINVLAIVLTARVLGFELGIVRAAGAIVFAVVIGLAMHLIFRKDEHARAAAVPLPVDLPAPPRRLWQVTRDELGEWIGATWGFAKQILPLLLAGVLLAGLLLGRPGHEGLIPSRWVTGLVGGNGLFANFSAAFAGAFMYFATLTEVPILQGLIGAGMGKGPALALLLAGPALSLPSMLVIRSVLGTKKTLVYVGLVVVFSTAAGLIYGSIS